MSNYLKLNETEKFKEFEGMNIEQMPKIIKEGRVPLRMAGLMEQRLEVLTSSDRLNQWSWLDNYFDTGDAIIYLPEGKFKIVLDAELMRKVTLESKLLNCALPLPRGLYGQLDGEEFTRKEVEKYGFIKKLLTRKEAKNNPIWKALAGQDQTLLDDYVEAVFDQAGEQYGYNKNMRIWLSKPQNLTNARLWCSGGLRNFSYAGGHISLDNDHGRLIGVTP